MDKHFFKSFHIAGFSYYQGPYVFGDLKIGTKIDIAIDDKNIHDEFAVQLSYEGHKLGYIPKHCNQEIFTILKAGHEIFECIVQQIIPDEHPEKQIRVAIFVI